MSRVKGWLARARSVLRPRDAESRMEEEFRFHVEMETARLVREGVTPDDAKRRALATFGGLDTHRETMRDERGARWFEDLAADVRYALRGMRRSPGFAVAAAVTLGVGIGVNGMIFGFVNTMHFRPIPARAPGELVSLFARDVRNGNVDAMAYEDYADFRDRSGVFAGIAAFSGTPLNFLDPATGAGGAADLVWAEMVTENYFSVLDMRPAAGRFFTAADAPQGANPFVVLSYESWLERFGGDPDVSGRVVRLNGTEFTVTGVAPRGFRGMRQFGFWPEMWVPIGMHAVIQPGSTRTLQGRGLGSLMTVARMKSGFDRERTQTAAALFARQLEASHPASNTSVGVLVVPGRVGFDNPAFVKPAVLVLSSSLGVFAALLTLLVICANLANLQLARAATRAREIAIRLSLGCSRARLTRQLLVEAAVLALPGLLAAAALVRLTEAAEPYLVPRLQFQVGLDARADYRVTLFTAAVAVVAILLFGLLPAVRASRPQLKSSLSGLLGGVGTARGRRAPRLRGVLVVTQLALSVVLLAGGMLFVRSLVLARRSDVGFDHRDRVMASMNVGLQGYDRTRGVRFYDAVLARVRALPGVEAASFVFPAPFDTYNNGILLYAEGFRGPRSDGSFGATVSFVGDDFTRALGVRLLAGRDITGADTAGAPRVMVVSQSFASRIWPGKDAIGQRARSGDASGPEMTVVGVVEDAKFAIIGDAGGPRRVYVPVAQRYRDWETLIVHARGNAEAMIPRVRDAIAAIDPTLPTFGMTTMADAVSSGFSASRVAALVAGFFGLLALLIASVGLYAVVASSVAERTREIGVRMALGATPRGVLGHVMRGGARLGAIGLAIGVAGALGVARTMASLLYGVSPSDPVTFALVPIALAAVVLLATYLPARRAVKLDPVAALRSE